MANSDNAYGVFNKQTKIIYQKQHQADSSWDIISQSFSGNLTTAKNFFLTAEAQACINDNGTQVQFAITDDGNGLKWTVAFGTPTDASQKPWATKYTETKATLIGSDGWVPTALRSNWVIDDDAGNTGAKQWFIEDSSDHLF